MVQADDRGGLREAVPLNHDVTELGPERLEVAVKGCGADDEGPEFPAEQAVNGPIPPPPAQEVLFGPGHLRVRRHAEHVFAQHVEDVGHGHEH